MELTQRPTIAYRAAAAPANQQSRLVIALVLLLVALAAVLIKDRQFWFGSESTIVDANDYHPPVAAQTAPQTPAQASAQPAAIKAAAAATPARVIHKEVASSPSQPTLAEAPAPAVVGNRTVVPPLDVEVVAGEKHRNLQPRSNTTNKVQTAKPSVPAASQPAPAAGTTTNVAPRERLAEAIQPTYPALAQHMNVQGSVVLQALIGADGRIQNLRVVSGPAILSTAAQQAVREWQFKPVYQNGQPVETRATITVNFSIKVNDTTANTSVARNDDALVISR